MVTHFTKKYLLNIKILPAKTILNYIFYFRPLFLIKLSSNNSGFLKYFNNQLGIKFNFLATLSVEFTF